MVERRPVQVLVSRRRDSADLEGQHMIIASQIVVRGFTSIAIVFASTTIALSEERGGHHGMKSADFHASKPPITAYEKSEAIRLQSENFFRRINDRSNSAIHSICSGCMGDSEPHGSGAHHGFKPRPASLNMTSE